MKTFQSRCVLLAPLALVASAGGMARADVDVIFTKIPASPTSVVPGALDLTGAAVVTNFRAMEDVRVSPDGTRWILKGRTQLGSDLETNLLQGGGTFGVTLAQEGQPVPGAPVGELFDFFGSRVGQFDDTNKFAFSARARGGATATAQKVLLWDPGVGTLVQFQQGDLITGLSDTTVSGDEIVGNSVGAIHLLNDGRIGAHDPTIGNISTTRRPALYYKGAGGGAIAGFQQTGVTTVLGLGGSGPQVWTTLSDTFQTTPDGTRWLTTGRIGTTDVFAVDGQVVLQQGQPVLSSSIVADAFFQTTLMSGGSWSVRGDIPGDDDFAVVDGVLVAKTGDAITPGSTENWGVAFQSLTNNDFGDWVIAGDTTHPDPAVNAVIVVNRNRVILREGDAVDVDGDGQFDDNAFVGRGNNTLSAFDANDVIITNRREVYAIINLRDGQGNDLNSNPAFTTPSAFVRITWCVADVDDGAGGGVPDGGVTIDDLIYYLTLFEAGDVGADVDDGSGAGVPDGGVTIDDLIYYLTRFEGGC
jgi:hypothetical protein